MPGNTSYDVSSGDGGDANQTEQEGNDGNSGNTLDDLQLPLNGFLFNTLDGPDTICAGEKPKKILGSQPRSKSVSYIYSWLESSDGSSWSLANGTGNMLEFEPDEISSTTYYTRVIIDTLTDEPLTDPARPGARSARLVAGSSLHRRPISKGDLCHVFYRLAVQLPAQLTPA